MKNVFIPPYAALVGSLGLTAPSLAFSAPAGAVGGIVINATQDGTGVTFGFSGSLNTSGLGVLPSESGTGRGINASFGVINFIPTASFETINLYNNVFLSGPISFGTGGPQFNSAVTSSSGGIFVLQAFNGGRAIGVSPTYTSGQTISGQMFYSGQTFDALGVTTGTYQWSLTNNETITLNVGATPVPFESDALPVVGATLFMAGGLWCKRKRAQAKVADFVAEK